MAPTPTITVPPQSPPAPATATVSNCSTCTYSPRKNQQHYPQQTMITNCWGCLGHGDLSLPTLAVSIYILLLSKKTSRKSADRNPIGIQQAPGQGMVQYYRE